MPVDSIHMLTLQVKNFKMFHKPAQKTPKKQAELQKHAILSMHCLND